MVRRRVGGARHAQVPGAVGVMDVQVALPAYARDIQPLWDAQCTNCHNSSSGTRGGLNLDTGKSYASIVNTRGPGSFPATCGALSPFDV